MYGIFSNIIFHIFISFSIVVGSRLKYGIKTAETNNTSSTNEKYTVVISSTITFFVIA